MLPRAKASCDHNVERYGDVQTDKDVRGPSNHPTRIGFPQRFPACILGLADANG